MNKTMIALVAVSLGALLPVPTAQAIQTAEACAQKEWENLGLDLPRSEREVCIVECAENPGVFVVDRTVCPTLDPASELDACEKGSLGIRIGAGQSLPDDRYVALACNDPAEEDPFGRLDGLLAKVQTPTDSPACSDTDDGSGWGNPHAHCEYACGKAEFLAIHVKATDDSWGTATASGNTSCGGASAICDKKVTKNECMGASEQPTRYAQNKGSCDGYSDEWIDDPVMVSCYSLGATSMICQALPPLCEDPALMQSSISRECSASNPTIDPESVAGLLALLPKGVVPDSYVAFTMNTAEPLFVRLGVEDDGAGSGQFYCESGPY